MTNYKRHFLSDSALICQTNRLFVVSHSASYELHQTIDRHFILHDSTQLLMGIYLFIFLFPWACDKLDLKKSRLYNLTCRCKNVLQS